MAARGERKVKEAGKVGNSGSFPCDSSRSEHRGCRREREGTGDEEGVNKKEASEQ